MRFDKAIAHAFGPLSDCTLELGPGLNVIYGPNEAGKSTWHTALYVGLCGVRRGRGARMPDFVQRHRPWDERPWQVSVYIRLEDGRRVEFHRDLNDRRDARVVDVDLGRDYSGEIIRDGAPDGSVWLGLDRQSFLTVGCVQQADLLGVRKEAKSLQEHLQRAAATAGAESTAAQALARLEQFSHQHVGRDDGRSKQPLRLARIEVESKSKQLKEAQDAHAEYLKLCQDVEERAAEVAETQRRLRLAEAGRALREAREWQERWKQASELAAQFPEGAPTALVEDDDLAREVAAALRGWEERPQAPLLSGRSAAELREEIQRLPLMPEGDTEPHPEVLAAWDDVWKATQALQLHDDMRPSAGPAPATGGASEEELRDLARELSTPVPALDPTLVERVRRAKERLDGLSRSTGRPRILPRAAGVLAAAGAILAVVGLVAFGVALAASGIALALAGGTLLLVGSRATGGKTLQAVEAELRTAEWDLERATKARAEAEQRRDAAARRVAELGVPADPDSLRALASEVGEAARAAREAERWQERRNQLSDALAEAEKRLGSALRARSALGDGDLQEAGERYRRACQARAEQAQAARRRSELERQLRDREAAEVAAADAESRRAKAANTLREAARRCGIDAQDEAALADRLREWQQLRAERLRDLEDQQRRWAKLQGLLGGKTLEALKAEAREQQERVERLKAELGDEAVETAAQRENLGEVIEQLNQDVERAKGAWNMARGHLEARARGLPSVAEAEEALARAEAELERIQQLGRTIERTKEFLQRAQERAYRDLAPVLRESVARWLPRVTLGRYHEVAVDPQTLEVRVRDGSGALRSAELLSHGTAEQVYLLLRIAIAQHLARPGEVCPLLLDDVTVQSDRQRTQAILDTLHAVSRERQVILFTQEDEVLAWAEAHLQAPNDRLLRLSPTPVAA